MFLMLAGVILASLITTVAFIGTIRGDTDRDVQAAADALGKNIDEIVKNMEGFEGIFFDGNELARFIYRKDVFQLNKRLMPFLKMSPSNTVTVTDENGVILSRPQTVAMDNEVIEEYIGLALDGRATLALSRATPRALGVFYVAPVMRGSAVAGTIAIGADLGDAAMLDRLSGIYGAEMSIFFEGERVSTTIKKDGERVIGAKIAPDAYEATKRGQMYFSEYAMEDGVALRTLYEPFMFDGKNVGAIAVGIPAVSLERAAANAKTSVISIVIAFAVVAMPTTWLSSRNISRLAREKTTQEIYLSLLMNSCPDIILIFDERGRFVDYTENFIRQVGVDGGAIIGRTFSEAMADSMAPAEAECISGAIIAAMNDMKTISLESSLSFNCKDQPHMYSGSFTPMIDEESRTIGVLALFHDTSDVIQAQRAEAASRAKTAFLANMSHEIRTPLNAIIGLSEVEQQNDLPPDTRNSISKICAAASTLLGIVNDVLDISKIESGKFEIVETDYDFANLINDTARINVVRIASKPITFNMDIDADIPSKLRGDEVRIKQIISNLLSNAFKYTKEGAVALKITCARRKDTAMLAITVSDTGIGIKKEDMENLFEEYVKFDESTNHKVEGTGLGLSITHSLVDKMNGAIEVASEYGKGSVFTVTIPQGIADPTPIGNEAACNLRTFRLADNANVKKLAYVPMQSGKVLVVDDVPTNLDVARRLMAPYGLTIHCVSSGKQAIGLIREGKTIYDIIFMDHMMPEMDGVKTVGIIRNEIGTEYARTVPIIALTANAMAGNEEMFLQCGFQAYISKPIDIMKLDGLLKRWIGNAGPDGICGLPPNPAPGPAEANIGLGISQARIDGIDLEEGLSIFAGEETYMQVLRSYANYTPALLERAGGVRKETLADYAIIVHGIKGSSRGICAHKIGEMAEKLEASAKAGDFETVAANNEAFIGAARALIDALRDLQRKFNTSLIKERADAPDPALLERLAERARNYDTTGVEEIMSALERFTYESGGDSLEWLREKADSLDYGEIVERLTQGVAQAL
jgi:signal transduction histidine kinase/ActR/RegA family two-component response regulator